MDAADIMRPKVIRCSGHWGEHYWEPKRFMMVL